MTPVEYTNGRDRFTSAARRSASQATNPPATPSALPPVCTVASTRSLSPAAATAPAPCPNRPVAWASSTMTCAPVRLGCGRQGPQRRQVAVHAEHALGDHVLFAFRGRRGVEQTRERVGVPVRIDDAPRAREPQGVDDRGVVQGVREHGVLGLQQGREQARVGLETRGIQEPRRAPAEAGERPLRGVDLGVRGVAHQARGRRAHGQRAHRVGEPVAQHGVLGETQEVVRDQVQGPGPRFGERAQQACRPTLLQPARGRGG